MQSGLLYLIDTLAGLYLIAIALRLAMQWVRADWRNPIVQFVVNVTNPLIVPLQKILVPIYKLDTATLVVLIALQLALLSLLTWLSLPAMPPFPTLLWAALLRSLELILNTYFYVIFGYILLSWISGGSYNPSLAMLSTMLRDIAEPVLAPVRRVIPPISGFDLSPIFVLIGIQFLLRTL
ncbi:MAG: YggT family protein [Gammaproteobacteria bacterium]|nr:YggT family protein [Gammaproteobacteria bacterium]NND53736.1 YggT family protein [Gammaproteobacteria bacterium]